MANDIQSFWRRNGNALTPHKITTPSDCHLQLRPLFESFRIHFQAWIWGWDLERSINQGPSCGVCFAVFSYLLPSDTASLRCTKCLESTRRPARCCFETQTALQANEGAFHDRVGRIPSAEKWKEIASFLIPILRGKVKTLLREFVSLVSQAPIEPAREIIKAI